MSTLKPYPKPTRDQREAEKRSKKQGLKEWRQKNVEVAISRDAGYCVICWFRDNKKVPYQEVHHVFSRGNSWGDWHEDYHNLMCVCQACHPQPIITPGASANLGWVEDILKKANDTPINEDFKHYG